MSRLCSSTDLFGSFDNEQNAFSQHQMGDRFIFKKNSMYLEFDQPTNLALLPMYPYIENEKGVIVSTFPYSHRIWFDGKKFTLGYRPPPPESIIRMDQRPTMH